MRPRGALNTLNFKKKELAFQVKKIGYKCGIRIIFKEIFKKTALIFIPTSSPYAMNVTEKLFSINHRAESDFYETFYKISK